MGFASLIAQLGLNIGPFSKGIDAAGAKINGLKSQLAGTVAGAFGAGALIAFSKSVIDLGSSINDMSTRLGVSTDSLQEWTYAARQTGAHAEDVQSFFEKLGIAKEQALSGDEGFKFAKAFAELGVSLDDLKSKRVDQLAMQIASVFKAGGDPQALIGALREVGGKGVGGLIPAMTDGMAGFAAEVRNAGQLIEENIIKKLDEAGDKISASATRLKAEAAPAIVTVLESANWLVSKIGEGASYWGWRAGGGKLMKGQSVSDALGDQFQGPPTSAGFKFAGGGGSGVKIPNNPQLKKELEDVLAAVFKATATDDQLLAQLKQKRNDAIGEYYDTSKGTDEELRAKIKIGKLDREIAEASRNPNSAFVFDSLSKVGGSQFGSSAQYSTQEKQVSILMQIERNTSDLTGLK